jgi:hypothetical protein
MSTPPVPEKAPCACSGPRLCLTHFAALSATERSRVLLRLDISNPRPTRSS